VFLHSVEEGPANESYGLQVAQLAGVPAAVIRAARKNLALLEEHGLAAGPQRDLFAAAAAAASADAAPNDAAAHRILDALRAADPDALSPKEALELVYRLRRELDE
jgi:DNA mismatch repair protein MutS